MASAAETAAMRRAIALSAAGLGATSPNPPVGCVLLGPSDQIVGEGYHERKGEAHAEAQALAAAGPLAAGATAVVTLEPCTGQGVGELPSGTGEARRLRLNADAVLGPDGTVREAVPGSHGKGILALQDLPPGRSAAEMAAALYDGGVRRLLLGGGYDAAAPFLGAGLVDRVVACLPHGNASSRPAADLPWPLLPPGFVIAGTIKTENFVRVDGRPDALR